MTKILIIRLSSLGDIIHTFPMVNDIKKNVPNCQIDWLTDENFAQIVNLSSSVDNVIKIPLRNWKKNILSAFLGFSTWKKTVINQKYDYIIDVQGLVKSAILTKLFIGNTYGFGINCIKERLATKFYKTKIEVSKNVLAVNKNRILAKRVFGYDIDLNKTDFGIKLPGVEVELEKIDNYVIFFHASSKENKKYSVSDWATLADYLIKVNNVKIVLPFGNLKEKKEALQIKEIVDSENVIIYDNVLDYFSLVKLIKEANFIFGVDTGLIHLANALDKKLIAIYINTDPKMTGILESEIAKNISAVNKKPLISDVIDLYEKINKPQS